MSANFISNFYLRFRNAKKVISQIKAGEWVAEINDLSNEVYIARRNGRALWIANGAFFCDLVHPGDLVKLNAFGLIFRHWGWWSAARKLKVDADEKLLAKHETPRL